MKFRRLVLQELREVEADFVKFLAAQGVTSDLWIRMQREPQVLEEQLDAFSDLFWESRLSDINYLMFDDGERVWHFSFGDTHAVCFALKKPDETGIQSAESGVKTYAQEDRSKEIYDLLEQGAQPVDGKAFTSLAERTKLEDPAAVRG
jgi:hypothetical protein